MSSTSLNSRSSRTPAIVSFGVLVIGCLVLVGWETGSVTLKSVHPSLRPMVPGVAISLLFGGVSLLLLSRPRLNQVLLWVGRACAILVALIAITSLIERVLGLNLAIDQWAFRAEGDLRLPTSTAVSLLLVSAALLSLNVETRSGWRPAELLALTAIVIALLTLLGYTYGVVVLYRISPNMAVHSAIALLLLSGGILKRTPRLGEIDGGRHKRKRRRIHALVESFWP